MDGGPDPGGGRPTIAGLDFEWPDEDDFETARDPLVVEPLVGVFDEYIYWQWACSEGMYEGEEAQRFPLSISPACTFRRPSSHQTTYLGWSRSR